MVRVTNTNHESIFTGLSHPLREAIFSVLTMRSSIRITLVLLGCLSIAAPITHAQKKNSKPAAAVAPAADDKALKFLAIGDWGDNGQESQQAVANEMGKFNQEFEAKFVISTGDNFYCCGVASVDDPQWMSSYENVYRNHSLQIDWNVVLGNHDYQGNPQAEIDYSKKSRRWIMPSRYYTQVKKVGKNATARFVYLDTNPFIDKYLKNPDNFDHIKSSAADAELAWLDSVLSNSKETWKIVIGHHPVYSSGSEHGNQPELIARLEPVLEKYHVDAYFSGHEHDLQHQKRADGTVNYFVSGSGGEPRPTGKTETTKFSSDHPGFMAITLKKDAMDVDAIDSKGKKLYSTTLSK